MRNETKQMPAVLGNLYRLQTGWSDQEIHQPKDSAVPSVPEFHQFYANAAQADAHEDFRKSHQTDLLGRLSRRRVSLHYDHAVSERLFLKVYRKAQPTTWAQGHSTYGGNEES